MHQKRVYEIFEMIRNIFGYRVRYGIVKMAQCGLRGSNAP